MRKILGIILTLISALFGVVCVVSGLQLINRGIHPSNKDAAFIAGYFAGKIAIPIITGSIAYFLYTRGQKLLARPTRSQD